MGRLGNFDSCPDTAPHSAAMAIAAPISTATQLDWRSDMGAMIFGFV
jgi:hypothetical protein